jgi:hypothetical protein
MLKSNIFVIKSQSVNFACMHALSIAANHRLRKRHGHYQSLLNPSNPELAAQSQSAGIILVPGLSWDPGLHMIRGSGTGFRIARIGPRIEGLLRSVTARATKSDDKYRPDAEESYR